MPLAVPCYRRLAYKRGKGERLASFHRELIDFVRSWRGCLDSLCAVLSAALPALMRSGCGAALQFSAADRSQVKMTLQMLVLHVK